MAALVDLEVMVHRDTEKAFFVSTDGFRSSAVWVPKSQVEYEPKRDNPIRGTITLPVWLATEKGLV